MNHPAWAVFHIITITSGTLLGLVAIIQYLLGNNLEAVAASLGCTIFLVGSFLHISGIFMAREATMRR